MEGWPLFLPEVDSLTDVFDTHGDLQVLLGKHVNPSQETQDLIAIRVDDMIIAQVL